VAQFSVGVNRQGVLLATADRLRARDVQRGVGAHRSRCVGTKKAASHGEAVKDCGLSGRKTPLQGSLLDYQRV